MDSDNALIVLRLLQGALISVEIALLSVAFGSVGGVTFAILGLSGQRVARFSVRAIVALTRGIPMIVQVFAIFYLLPLIGLDVGRFATAVISLSLFASVSIGEIVRGGLLAVGEGQLEAARSLGFSARQVYRLVILPQAMRFSLGPLIGQFVFLIKATAIISLLGVSELMLSAREIIEQNLEGMKVMGLVWAIYGALCFPISHLGRRLESRWSSQMRS